VTPVYKLSANSVKNGRTVYGSMLAGNTAFVATDFQSIATVSVGSGGAANVEFTSIPATYTHLQVRIISRNSANDNQSISMQFNSDTGNNYARHRLYGLGSSVGADGSSSTNLIIAGVEPTATSTFGASIVDILDYANTNKYKTARVLSGRETNSVGSVFFNSGLWQSTNAITSIKLAPESSTFAQYSHFALYGIKSA
jgi:hypothetical protein